jgi:hypothetical protein
LLVGIWVDAASGRKPDAFSIPTLILLALISWPPAEFGRDVIQRLRYSALAPLIGILTVAISHALPTLLAGLVNVPRTGLSFLPEVLMGFVFTLERALIPSLVVGSSTGVVVFVLLKPISQRSTNARP